MSGPYRCGGVLRKRSMAYSRTSPARPLARMVIITVMVIILFMGGKLSPITRSVKQANQLRRFCIVNEVGRS